MRQAAFAFPSESRQRRKFAAQYEWQDTVVLLWESFVSLLRHVSGFARPSRSHPVPGLRPGHYRGCLRQQGKGSLWTARLPVPDKSGCSAA